LSEPPITIFYSLTEGFTEGFTHSGLAIAHDFAVGGLAIAAHANDETAKAFLTGRTFFSVADAVIKNSRWFLLLALIPLALGWRQLKTVRDRRRKTDGPGIFICLALLGTIGCQGASARPPIVESRSLTNGIRVVAIQFPGSTNCAIFTFLSLGLAGDGPAQTQWSHLVEHLVIRSTVSPDSPAVNAETLPDHMRLDFYGNITNWEEGLKHTADWLVGVPFTQRILDAEKLKVNGEVDFTVKNLATHKFAVAAWAQGYRHNRNHALVRGDIANTKLAEIQEYRDERLVILTNTLVCVVGGLEPGKTLERFAARLSGIQSEVKSVGPMSGRPGARDMAWDLDARHLILTWPISSLSHKDYPTLLVAAQWLNGQFFSDQELKRLTGMVFAGADLATPEGNFFFVSASLRPEASFETVHERIERPLQQLLSGNGDLSAARLMGKQLAESLMLLPDPEAMKAQLPPNTTATMVELNIGLQWGMNEYRYGPYKTPLAAGLGTISPEQVQRTAQKYLAPSNASVVRLRPTNTVSD
jgi:predicted Zn-dependent peptidase